MNNKLYVKIGTLVAWVFFAEVVAAIAVLFVLLARSLVWHAVRGLAGEARVAVGEDLTG
jgi:hypothetical protein